MTIRHSSVSEHFVLFFCLCSLLTPFLCQWAVGTPPISEHSGTPFFLRWILGTLLTEHSALENNRCSYSLSSEQLVLLLLKNTRYSYVGEHSVHLLICKSLRTASARVHCKHSMLLGLFQWRPVLIFCQWTLYTASLYWWTRRFPLLVVYEHLILIRFKLWNTTLFDSLEAITDANPFVLFNIVSLYTNESLLLFSCQWTLCIAYVCIPTIHWTLVTLVLVSRLSLIHIHVHCFRTLRLKKI